MKKVSIILIVLFFGIAIKGFSQTISTPTADSFIGKWEILIIGTPSGDSKLITELIRKDGKLTGELKDPAGKLEKPIQIDEIIEEEGKIILGFSAQGMSISLELAKVDNDNLKGSLMSGRFDAKAVRIK